MDTHGAAQLARWGISPAAAAAAGVFHTQDARAIYPEMPSRPALVIPYFNFDHQYRMTALHNAQGEALPFARLRWLDPASKVGFTKAKVQRYTQPAHTGVAPYLWPGADWQTIIGDPQYPIIITEGEAKAIAGSVAGFTVIAFGGVFSFTTPTGALLPDLEAIVWAGRGVYICYDSDAISNPNVLAAEARLIDELQRKRGAHCHLVRLPPAGDSKQGMDDYLLAHGAGKFAELLTSAPSLGALDAKVMGLNESVAWIEREGMVYDHKAKMFIRKESFINGSRYSTLKHITVGASQRTAVKTISVANEWLTHSHAARFDEILFRPGNGVTVTSDQGGLALNMWTGFETTEGDVRPFLELTTHILRQMRPEHRDLPLKLVAYKAQNPAEKVPLALMFVGPQGSGKSLWGECVAEAFGVYGQALTPAILLSEYQGWLETSLFCTVNEAKGEDMRKGAEVLRGLISDLRRPMNEKFRPARQVNSYAMYCVTANDRSAGSFRSDDRRMIVINAPKPDRTGLYERVGAWKKGNGPRALMGWLLALDLKGWKPPQEAPMSAEKYLAYVESLTPAARLAEEMQTSGQDTIRLWLDAAVVWANMSLLSPNTQIQSMARATLDNIGHYQIRPWYQPEELALMFPAIASQTLGSKIGANTTAGQISRELRDAGVPYLECADNPRGFMWRGRLCQYLVVSGFEEWHEPLSQANFERLMANWPTYGGSRR